MVDTLSSHRSFRKGGNMTIQYACNFNFDETNHFVIGDSIEDFKEGFWVDVDLQFTKGTNRKYWIPPSKIIFIEAS